MSEVIAQAAQAAVQGAMQGAQAGSPPKETAPPGSGADTGIGATAAPIANPKEGKAENDYAERFAQMARRERRLQEESRQATTRTKELEARLERLKTEPESVLGELGWNPEKYLERLATGKTPDPTVEDRVKSLQDEIAALKKDREDRDAGVKADTEQKAIATYQKSLNTVVEQNPDRYEAIKSLDMQELVWTTAQEVFARTKKIPDPQAVADAVEKDLRSKLELGFKMKAFADRSKPTDQSAPEFTPHQNHGGTTLTAQTTAATQPPSTKPLSDEERMARAAALLKFGP